MAMKFKDRDGNQVAAARGDFYKVPLNAINADPANRGRFEAPSEATIRNLAISIHDHGQQNPCVVQKVAGEMHLISGFTRYAAVRMLEEGFEHLGKQYHIADVRLNVTVQTAVSAEQALILNIIENNERTEQSSIDDAHNQARLRDVHGKTNSEIAALYNWRTDRVSRTAQLLELPQDIQLAVHRGIVSTHQALQILSRSADLREVGYAEIRLQVKGLEAEAESIANSEEAGAKGKGRGKKVKIDAAAVEDAMREAVLSRRGATSDDLAVDSNDGEGDIAIDPDSIPAARGKKTNVVSRGTSPIPEEDKVSRGLKHLKRFIVEAAEGGSGVSERGLEVISRLDQWLEGSISDKSLMNTFKKL